MTPVAAGIEDLTHKEDHQSVLSSLTKPEEIKHILKYRPFLQYKTWVENFWTSCAPHEDKKCCKNLVAGVIHCIWALTQLLSISSHTRFGSCPILSPVRCWGTLRLPPCAQTHPHGAAAHPPLPNATSSSETLGWREGHGSATCPFGESTAQGGEEAGGNRCS